MKLLLISIVFFGALASIVQGTPLYIKGANGKGENEIHGTDPDKEEAGEPADTLPAEFDFGDIPLSNVRAEDPEIIAEEDSGAEQDFIVGEDDGEDDPDYIPEQETEDDLDYIDESVPEGVNNETPAVSEVESSDDEGNGEEDLVDWEDADTDNVDESADTDNVDESADTDKADENVDTDKVEGSKP